MKSIIERLGTEDFPRLRVALGARLGKWMPGLRTAGILSPGNRCTPQILTRPRCAADLCHRRSDKAMNQYNGALIGEEMALNELIQWLEQASHEVVVSKTVQLPPLGLPFRACRVGSWTSK
jgi:hypothetical protein